MAGSFREVVIGMDGSANARRAVAFVARLKPAGRATLVQAVEPVRTPSMPLVPATVRDALAGEAAALERARRRRAERGLEAAARHLAAAGWRVRTEVRAGIPLAELFAAVKRAGAGLLVVGARGTTGIERLLLGSVADGAIKRSPVPTLIVT
jgi:nucleotide-binding universal stress UspA family protein